MRIPTLLIFVASGFFFASAYLVSGLYFFSLIGLTLILAGIYLESSPKKLFWFGWFVGLCIYGSAFFWTWDTFPVKWIDANKITFQLVAIGSYWFTTSAVVSVSVGLFTLVVKKFLSKPSVTLLVVPFLWVFREICSSALYSVYSLGTGSEFSIEFGFGYIGYLMVKHEVFGLLGSLLGVYSLSYFGAFVAVVFFLFFRLQLYTKVIYKSVLILFLLGMIIVPQIVAVTSVPIGQRIVTVETYFDKEFDSLPNKVLKKQEIMLDVLGRALQEEAHVIILPEESRVTDIFETSDDLFMWVQAQSPVFNGIIIDSGRALDERGEIVMRAFMYDVKTESYSFFDKQYLTPQGEYLPYFQKFIFSKLMSKEQFKTIEDGLVYRQGVVHDSYAIPSNYPAILFCFESVNTMGVRGARTPRQPSFVAHLVSHTWFKEAHSLWSQLDGMLSTQAIWSGTPIVSATNMWQNKLYLPNGHIETGETIATQTYWSLKVFEI